MPREPNAIDFWRGFALVTIFVNHIPGIYFERFTHRNISYSDSAELFVFLAGWGLCYVVDRYNKTQSPAYLLWWLSHRALKIYAAQILIISLAVAMLAAASIILDNPLVVTWHNAEAVFYDPVRANIGLVLLTHQLGYFDILPLYVVMTMFAPALAMLDRYAPSLVLPISAAIYLLALVFEINIPTWPVAGEWFFNPLAWQFIFVLGFVLAKKDGFLGGGVRRHIRPIRAISLAAVIGTVMLFWFDMAWIDPTYVPEPRLLFINHKAYETPTRLLHFLALAAVFSAAYPTIARFIPRITRALSLLGRHSLSVFCVGSLLSLAAQIVRFGAGWTIGVDTLILVVGISCLLLTAWLADWPKKATRSS
jgi:hypothetical protein